MSGSLRHLKFSTLSTWAPFLLGGEQAPLLFPGEVHYELLGLAAVQLKVALPTPVCEVGDLTAVGSVSSKHEDEQLISEPL